MHLAVQQGVDKINSLQADMLLPEEIDIELNKSMSRFINTKYGINNKYNKGFEESQKRIDDLRSLVVEYAAPVNFKEQYNNKIWVDTFRLPPDYLYLVSQRSNVIIDNCDPINFSIFSSGDFSYFLINESAFHNSTIFIDRMRLVADPTDPSLGNISMLNLLGTDAPIEGTYAYPADEATLHLDITDPNNWATGFEWYHESYSHIQAPGFFICIVDTNLYPWFNYDSSVTNSVSSTNLVTQAVGMFKTSIGLEDPLNTTTDALYNDTNYLEKREVTSSNDITADMTLNKFVQHDDVAKLLNDPFNTTKHTSPLTTIRDQYIDIYTSDIFIIQDVKITYIRKPQQISLSLGISCELPIHTHQEIVDITVSSILEGIGDPRYKSASNEANKNE